MKGGAINHMPVPGSDVLPIANPTDLQRLMDFYSLIGHGGMLPMSENFVFKIPDNTWILFISRAGESTPKIKQEDDLLNDFRYFRPGETREQWHERIYTGMRDGSLFRDILYKNENSTNKLSIYEPGDIVQDMTLVFKNLRPPWDPVGIWKVPLQRNHLEHLEKIRRDFNEFIRTLPEVNELIARYMSTQENDSSLNFSLLIDVSIRALNIGQTKALDEFSKEKPAEMYNLLKHDAIMDLYVKIVDIEIKALPKIIAEQQRQETAFYNWPAPDYNYYSRIDEVNKSTNSVNLYHLLRDTNGVLPTFNIDTSGLNRTPRYRFFLIDTCRALQEDKEEVFTATRALSGSVRTNAAPRVCSKAKLLAQAKVIQTFKGFKIFQDLLEDKPVPASIFYEVFTKLRNAKDSLIPIDTKVTFKDMTKNPELNGTSGTVKDYEYREGIGYIYKVHSDHLDKVIPIRGTNIAVVGGGKRSRKSKKHAKKKNRHLKRKTYKQ